METDDLTPQVLPLALDEGEEVHDFRVRKVERYIVTEYHAVGDAGNVARGPALREICGPTTMAQANEIAAMYGAANPRARVITERSVRDDSTNRDRVAALAAELGMQVASFMEDNRETFVIVPKGVQYRIYSSGDYIGAGFSVDPREGEDWRRGNDLPDGRYCDETWEHIRQRILPLHEELKTEGKA